MNADKITAAIQYGLKVIDGLDADWYSPEPITEEGFRLILDEVWSDAPFATEEWVDSIGWALEEVWSVYYAELSRRR